MDNAVQEYIKTTNCLEFDSILAIPMKVEKSIPDNRSVKMHMMII